MKSILKAVVLSTLCTKPSSVPIHIMGMFFKENHFACDQISGFKYSAKWSRNLDFPLIVIVMMMMMMVMIHRWCNFLRSRQLSYIVLFSSISSRHFTSSLLWQEISKVSSHLSQKGYWRLIFFCLQTCSWKSLSFLIPTPIIIVTDIERAMQSILQFSWTPKLQ